MHDYPQEFVLYSVTLLSLPEMLLTAPCHWQWKRRGQWRGRSDSRSPGRSWSGWRKMGQLRPLHTPCSSYSSGHCANKMHADKTQRAAETKNLYIIFCHMEYILSFFAPSFSFCFTQKCSSKFFPKYGQTKDKSTCLVYSIPGSFYSLLEICKDNLTVLKICSEYNIGPS